MISEDKKKYRSRDVNEKYITISLTFSAKLIEFFEREVKKTDSKNWSIFIEENVNEYLHKTKDYIPARRKYRSFPVKKTFTFTQTFLNKIKIHGNISMFIEFVLLEKFDL